MRIFKKPTCGQWKTHRSFEREVLKRLSRPSNHSNNNAVKLDISRRLCILKFLLFQFLVKVIQKNFWNWEKPFPCIITTRLITSCQVINGITIPLMCPKPYNKENLLFFIRTFNYVLRLVLTLAMIYHKCVGSMQWPTFFFYLVINTAEIVFLL